MSEGKSLIFEICNEVDNNNFLTTPLHKAVAEGNLEKLTQLLKSDADVNYSDFLGVTPLHSALLFTIRTYHHFTGEPLLEDAKKFKEITEFLLKAGADVNSRDHLGRTPLFYALAKFCPLVVVSTEEWNNPSIKKENLTQWEKDFLTQAAQTLGFNSYDRERVQELKEKNSANFIASTSFHYGTLGRYDIPDTKKLIETYNEDFSIVYTLLELGADLTIRDYDEKTIFSYILYNRGFRTISLQATKIFAQMESQFEKEAAKNIREEILHSNFAGVYHKCKTEIEDLKKRKACDWLSFSDILIKPVETISRYIKPENLMKILRSGEFENCEMYNNFLEYKTEKVVERGLLYDKCIGVVTHQFYIADRLLPDLIYDKILSFLSNCDLKNLSEIDC